MQTLTPVACEPSRVRAMPRLRDPHRADGHGRPCEPMPSLGAMGAPTHRVRGSAPECCTMALLITVDRGGLMIHDA